MSTQVPEWEVPKDIKHLGGEAAALIRCSCGEELAIDADSDPRTCPKCGRIYRYVAYLEVLEPNA